MDEISPAGSTQIWEVAGEEIQDWQLDPSRFGLKCDHLDGLSGGDPAENAKAIEELLSGRGTAAMRCASILNAAAALYVSGNRWSFEESVERSRRALESGAAATALAGLRKAAPLRKQEA